MQYYFFSPKRVNSVWQRLSLLLVFIFSAFGVSASNAVQSEIDKKQAYNNAMASWQYVLTHYVDTQGRTDFRRLADNVEPLAHVVKVIGQISPRSAPELFSTPEAVLAYHINTYNALAMYGVIEEGIPDGFTSFFSRAGFFKFRDVLIGGHKTNLYDYENKVIRPLNEPRAHFALNCMVKDCPRLPQTPFYPNTLDETLERLTREFFAKPKHFYLDEDKKRVYVSEILDFYTEDFVESGRVRDLAQYINGYLSDPIPEGYKIRFIDYDWRINAQPIVVESTSSNTYMLELYTSQGCNSCPPAEAWLSEFTEHEHLWSRVVPINFHVDYWDYLGWKDPFSNKVFSHRQRDYKAQGKSQTVATPGFALNGIGWTGWFRGNGVPKQLPALTGALKATVDNRRLNTVFTDIGEYTNDTTLVAHAALLGFGIETPVLRGENGGRTLKHDFVVIDYAQQTMQQGNEQFSTSLDLPQNNDVQTTKHALVVWVSAKSDPSPIQVAASWW